MFIFRLGLSASAFTLSLCNLRATGVTMPNLSAKDNFFKLFCQFLPLFGGEDVSLSVDSLVEGRYYFFAYGSSISGAFGIKLCLHLFDGHTIDGSCHLGLSGNKEWAASQYRETCCHEVMFASLKCLSVVCFF